MRWQSLLDYIKCTESLEVGIIHEGSDGLIGQTKETLMILSFSGESQNVHRISSPLQISRPAYMSEMSVHWGGPRTDPCI